MNGTLYIEVFNFWESLEMKMQNAATHSAQCPAFVSTSSRVVVPWQQRRPLPLHLYSHFQYYKKIVKMKLAIASLLVGSAAAFAPAATPIRSSALNMATETATEKVRYKICKSIERIFGFRCLYTCLRRMQRVSCLKQECNPPWLLHVQLSAHL